MPPWVTKKRIYYVDFFIPAEQLHAAAESLRADLRQFPPRDEDPFVR